MEHHGTRADDRLRFAGLIEPGDTVNLVRADGPLVSALVLAVEGIDLDLRSMSGELPPGALASTRQHSGDAAWFATVIVLAVDGDVTRVRIGDALRVTSERWTERVPLAGPAILRPEAGPHPIVRGDCVNASLTGIALRVIDEPPAPGTAVGVVLAGDGEGSIAFRGRVVRVGRASRGALVGIEMIGISRDDHRRLERAIARSGLLQPPDVR